jgi:hypothetical protein
LGNGGLAQKTTPGFAHLWEWGLAQDNMWILYKTWEWHLAERQHLDLHTCVGMGGLAERQHLDLYKTWNGTFQKDKNIWICTPRLGPGTRQHLGFAHLDWDLEQANTWIYTPGLGPGERKHLDLHTWNGTWYRTTVLGAGAGCGVAGERGKRRDEEEEEEEEEEENAKTICATRNGAEDLRSPVQSPIFVRLKCAVFLCYEPSLALHLRGASPSAMSSNQNRASRCVFGNKTKLSHNLSCPRLVLLSPFHLSWSFQVFSPLFFLPLPPFPFPLCLLIFSGFPLSRDYELLLSCFLLIGHW